MKKFKIILNMILNENFTTNKPNKVLDTDITYLSTIIDLYDGHVVT